MTKRSRPSSPASRKKTARRTASGKGKARRSTKASRPRRQSRLAAFLNSRYGVMLVGALLIFDVLMLAAMLPLNAGLLRGNSPAPGGHTPALIAAPLVEVATAAPSPLPTEADGETGTGPQTGGGQPPAENVFLPDWLAVQPTPDGAYRETRAPILMYHYVSLPPQDADEYRLDLSVTPERFEEQMDWLDENGFTTITLYELADWLARGGELPAKPVVLTFDDGYRDNYENAFPILQKHGQVGTFFILTGATEAGHPDYMSWDMLREMVAGGMDVEIHAHDHLDLAGRDPAYLELQVADSSSILEERLGYRPRFLAYPGGSYDENTIEALKQAGYWLGLTTRYGCLHFTGSEYELPRIRIRGEYGLETFASLLSAAFDDKEFCYGWSG